MHFFIIYARFGSCYFSIGQTLHQPKIWELDLGSTCFFLSCNLRSYQKSLFKCYENDFKQQGLPGQVILSRCSLNWLNWSLLKKPWVTLLLYHSKMVSSWVKKKKKKNKTNWNKENTSFISGLNYFSSFFSMSFPQGFQRLSCLFVFFFRYLSPRGPSKSVSHFLCYF